MRKGIKVGDRVKFQHWKLTDLTLTGTVTAKYCTFDHSYLTIKTDDGKTFDPLEDRCNLIS